MKCFEVPYSLPKLMPPSTLFRQYLWIFSCDKTLLEFSIFKRTFSIPLIYFGVGFMMPSALDKRKWSRIDLKCQLICMQITSSTQIVWKQ